MHKFRLSFSTIMDLKFDSEILKLSKKEGEERKRDNDKQLRCFFFFWRDKKTSYEQFIELNSSIFLIYKSLK